MNWPRRRRGNSGLTLIELVVAVAIMGIAFVTIVTGMLTSIFTSDIHRRQATTDVVLKGLSEKAQSAAYHDCTTSPASDYGLNATGYSVQVSVAYGDSTSSSFYTPPPPCSTDNGLQRLTITVTDSSGRDAETLEVVKRRTA